MGIIVVFDTNVLFSALWQPPGTPGGLVDAFVAGRVRAAYSADVFSEYRFVLFRPDLGLSPVLAARLLEAIQNDGVLVHPQPVAAVLFPDPADAVFIAAALATPERALVTGNVKHYPPRLRQGVKVLTPRQAFERVSL
ncbi:MAG: putative toxin-antitoxin system toxin component, PIN family [Opitutaceae bacterium]